MKVYYFFRMGCLQLGKNHERGVFQINFKHQRSHYGIPYCRCANIYDNHILFLLLTIIIDYYYNILVGVKYFVFAGLYKDDYSGLSKVTVLTHLCAKTMVFLQHNRAGYIY